MLKQQKPTEFTLFRPFSNVENMANLLCVRRKEELNIFIHGLNSETM